MLTAWSIVVAATYSASDGQHFDLRPLHEQILSGIEYFTDVPEISRNCRNPDPRPAVQIVIIDLGDRDPQTRQ